MITCCSFQREHTMQSRNVEMHTTLLKQKSFDVCYNEQQVGVYSAANIPYAMLFVRNKSCHGCYFCVSFFTITTYNTSSYGKCYRIIYVHRRYLMMSELWDTKLGMSPWSWPPNIQQCLQNLFLRSSSKRARNEKRKRKKK